MSLEQQTVFVSHSGSNTHVFPFNIPKLRNFPVKQPKWRGDGEYMRHLLSSPLHSRRKQCSQSILPFVPHSVRWEKWVQWLLPHVCTLCVHVCVCETDPLCEVCICRWEEGSQKPLVTNIHVSVPAVMFWALLYKCTCQICFLRLYACMLEHAKYIVLYVYLIMWVSMCMCRHMCILLSWLAS